MIYNPMSESFRQTLIQELTYQESAISATKDIVIIVHNQYNEINNCIQSIKKHTKDYKLLIWDNNSSEPTKSFLATEADLLIRNETNIGFIEPNNKLVAMGDSEYVILLNSDTIVSPGWDLAMLGLLQNRLSDLVGYGGGFLSKEFIGESKGFGEDVDYIEGWCMCFRRKLYDEIGLFDPNLKFAYGEDSDFSLKVKKNGYKLYALNLRYVKHIGGCTIKNVGNVSSSFEENHAYLREKWKSNGKT